MDVFLALCFLIFIIGMGVLYLFNIFLTNIGITVCILAAIMCIALSVCLVDRVIKMKRRQLLDEVLHSIKLGDIEEYLKMYDGYITVKSRRTLDKYDDIKYFNITTL